MEMERKRLPYSPSVELYLHLQLGSCNSESKFSGSPLQYLVLVISSLICVHSKFPLMADIHELFIVNHDLLGFDMRTCNDARTCTKVRSFFMHLQNSGVKIIKRKRSKM